jgi:hypothetical protein
VVEVTAVDERLGSNASRYRVVLDGQLVELPRLHAVLGALDRPGLNTWKLKMVARGVANDDNLAELCRDGREWAAVRTLLDAESPEAALGTAVHTATEALDTGRAHVDTLYADLLAVSMDDPYAWPPSVEVSTVVPYVRQWDEAKRRFRITIIEQERVVVDPSVDWAGRFDRMLWLEALGSAPVIADLKTGGVWPDAALQIAAYAHAPLMMALDLRSAARMPEVSRDVGLVVQLKPDGYLLFPVRLAEAWRAYQAARSVWQWSALDSKNIIGDALKPPAELPPTASSGEDVWPW